MPDDKFSSLLTQALHIRLECIKLAYRHDRSAGDVVTRAETFEKYVTGTPEKSDANDGQAEPDGPI